MVMRPNMRLAVSPHFVYDHIMDADRPDDGAVARIAAAIGEPARARMLSCLVDGRARTSTELALIAAVSPSTASAHLHRLKAERLVRVVVQGKHRYYSLDGPDVAAALESLSVLAAGVRPAFVPRTPDRLLAARTCYDHLAGTLGVLLHDRLVALGWLSPDGARGGSYDLTAKGMKAFEALGVDVEGARALRRRFAAPCLDWSERRPHLGGAMGAALLAVALRKNWVTQVRDSRALIVTGVGRRELAARFGVRA
jgi:DNA-binding transcriptional ArsR family regulator